MNLLTENRVKELINEFADRMMQVKPYTSHDRSFHETLKVAKFPLPETIEPDKGPECICPKDINGNVDFFEATSDCPKCNPPEQEEKPGQDLVDKCRVNWLKSKLGPDESDIGAWEHACKPLTDRIKTLEEQDRENAIKFRDLFEEKKTVEDKLNRIFTDF